MAVLYDKFYTKPEIAKQCYNTLLKTFPFVENTTFLEPSAGNGVFLPFLKRYKAYDIKPENENIITQDFLLLQPDNNNYTIIGNPPFGKRSQLAIDFFNHAALFGNIIAFIVPVSFFKWGVQSHLNTEFKLAEYTILPTESFLVKEKPYSIRTAFQIWARDSVNDYRIKSAPPIKHTDFQLWQYNATPQAEKVVEEDWKYAVYRQGYKDYSKIFTHDDKDLIKAEMSKGIQFFFIKPLTTRANDFVLECDFNFLAAQNISTPGFGKADFISYYLQSFT